MASFDQICTVTIYDVYGKPLSEIPVPDGYEVISFRLPQSAEPDICLQPNSCAAIPTNGEWTKAWGPRLILRKKPVHEGWWFEFVREGRPLMNGDYYEDKFGALVEHVGCNGHTLPYEARIYRRVERTK